MAEIRDGVEVYAEQVAQVAEAVATAMATAAAQQQQAAGFLSGPGEAGTVRPGPADAPNQ